MNRSHKPNPLLVLREKPGKHEQFPFLLVLAPVGLWLFYFFRRHNRVPPARRSCACVPSVVHCRCWFVCLSEQAHVANCVRVLLSVKAGSDDARRTRGGWRVRWSQQVTASASSWGRSSPQDLASWGGDCRAKPDSSYLASRPPPK